MEASQSFHSDSPGIGVVRWILMTVCVADVVLGCLIILIPRFLFRLFNVPLPDDILWFQLIGLMLIPGAVDGFVGFRASQRYRSNVYVSGASRFASAVFLLIVATARTVPWILIVLAIGEGLVGFLTVYYVMRLSALGQASGLQPRGGLT